MNATLFSDLAVLCDMLVATPGRNDKIRLIGEFLQRLNEDEIAPAVAQITGQIFPEAESRSLNIGYSAFMRLRGRKKQITLDSTPLTILKVNGYFYGISASQGSGSSRRRMNLLESLLGEAELLEARWIVKMISGEMQHGVNEGLMLEAIANAADLEPSAVVRAHMLLGDLGEVASTAMRNGEAGLAGITLQLFRPIKPMLAGYADSIEELLTKEKRWAFEYKFDGARIQIHKKGDEVRIFSRRLSDITSSLPEIVELAGKFRAGDAVMDGEVIAVRDGRPLPFQELMRRFRRIQDVVEAMKEVAVRLHLFDLLHIDGTTTIDLPYEKRWELLAGINGPLAKRMITRDAAEVEEFLDKSLSDGHEGIMAKDLDGPYTPGRRGWFKLKPVQTLDLVITAAEWGYGRRTGWLSNYHLAAKNDEGGFDVVGKTFRGLTDLEFKDITHRLLSLRIREEVHTVYVRPHIVVEVAFNEIQRSPTYRSGLALRFARITKIREDKAAGEADTMDTVREMYEGQFKRKSR